MKRSFFLRSALALVILTGLQNCNNKDEEPDSSNPAETGKAQVWLTKGDKSKLLSKEDDLSVTGSTSSGGPFITVDTAARFQEIEGYGAALTGSSAYLLHQKMNEEERLSTLQDLFDSVYGIGISYLRLTMGASDFSLSDFTYDDMPAGQTDFNLEQFSLAQDLDDVIPVLKEIIQIAPDIRLMGSPWSPPAWMKTNGSMKGGKLKEECYDVYADYFVKYIQAMNDEGITISSITPQNEPLYFTASYPCMEMQPGEQASFIKNNLGPKFQAAGINTKIIIYDHNWDNTNYAISILNDPVAKNYISGTAFHAYAGNVSAMSTVHYAHPDRDLYFTEISGGAWATDFGDNLLWNLNNIFIGTALNWSKNALLWNLVLDLYSGPQNNGCSNCRGVITLNYYNGAVYLNEEYYSLGHFSKFVRTGAVRIAATLDASLAGIAAVAFQNPNGTKVVVACNSTQDLKSFSVKQGNAYFSYTLPARSVVSIIW